MPESPRTKFRGRRRAKLSGGRLDGGLTSGKRQKQEPPVVHQLTLEREQKRNRWTGTCSCRGWEAKGPKDRLLVGHRLHQEWWPFIRKGR